MTALSPQEKRRLIKLRLVKQAERRLKATLGYLLAAVRIVVVGWPEDKARELFNQQVNADTAGRDRDKSDRSANRTQHEGDDRGGTESRGLEGS
jgi:hypothetical protein